MLDCIHFFEFFHKEILLISKYKIYVFFRAFEIWKLFFFLFFVSCEVRFLIPLDQIRMKIRRISFSFLFFRTIKLGSGGWMNGSIPYYFDCTVR